MSALGIEPDVDLQDLLELSVSDRWSVQFSPLLRGPAGAQGGTIIRRAAPWKGMTKGENESFDEYISRLESVNSQVASGLQRARQMALDNAQGAEGLAVVRKDGEVYPVPQAAANLIQAAGTGEVLASGLTSAADALDASIQRGGSRARFPTVY